MTDRGVRYPYEPVEAIPAGETLADWLESVGMRQSEFARRAGLSAKHINQVIGGTATLSPEVALAFERVTAIRARFWNQLEANYQTVRHQQSEAVQLGAHVDLLDRFPISALKKRGHLGGASTKVDTLHELLKFFGVATPAALEQVVLEPALYRKAAAFTSDDGALASWLRLAELAAREVPTAPFSKERCLELLPDIRSLSRWPDMSWRQPLIELCGSGGIAIVIVKELPGCRVNGATRWLTQETAMIALSLRHRRNDIFWFTLFHELCHVLRHGKKRTFIDDDRSSIEQDLESEADSFAARQLIPSDAAPKLERLRNATDVRTFAAELGIAPGIIVGRMRYLGLVPHSRWAELIEPYHFDEHGGEETSGARDKPRASSNDRASRARVAVRGYPELVRQGKDDLEMPKSERTSAKAAKAASKTLTSKSASKAAKSAAGSALAQTKNSKVTGRKAGSAAAKAVKSKSSSKPAKSAAGSALTQRPAKRKR